MPVLGCGAEIGKLMDVSDQDVASIEEVIAERLALGVSQAVAQRQAVDEVLAQLADERSMVMKAVQEQLGSQDEPAPFPEKETAPEVSEEMVAEPEPDEVPVTTAKRPATKPVFANKSQIGFYSALVDAIDTVPMKASLAQGWKDTIKGLVNKGTVKADELEWSGVNDWLSLQTGKVTKEQVVDYLDANGVQVQEVALEDGSKSAGKYENLLYQWAESQEADGNSSDLIDAILSGESSEATLRIARRDSAPSDVMGWAESYNRALSGESNTKYGQYTLPGGENYREVLLTLPGGEKIGSYAEWLGKKLGITASEAEDRPEYGDDAMHKKFMEEESSGGKGYKSSHWDQPNVLAHIRLNDRTDADGNKVLFVEEVQSDWGQDGKKRGFQSDAKINPTDDEIKEYFGLREGADPADFRQEMIEREQRIARSRGVPTAPFVGKTEGWLNLALKRIITMAVDGGYDKVAFVNGEQSADRYDLSKQVQQVMAVKDGDKFMIFLRDNAGKNHNAGILAPDELVGAVGKELADKIVAQKKDKEIYEGLDLKVGGEGMKTFYDSIVPQAVKKLLPKVGGGQMGTVAITQAEGFAGNARKAAARPIQTEQPGFTITDKMRGKAEQGMPLFSNKANTGSLWDAPPDTKADLVIQKLQDGRIDLKRVQDAIAEKTKKPLDAAFDARLSETLYAGRVATRANNFLKIEAQPLLEAMAKNNASMDELSDYLLARHAPEANAQIAKQGEILDGGAGSNSKGVLMTTAAANDYITNLSPGKRALMQMLAKKVDELTQGTRDLLLSEGLATADEIKNWQGAYKHYVPLFKEDALEIDGSMHPQGSGFSVTGSASKRRMGGKGEVTNMLAHVLMQREAAITRAEKNKVAMSLYALALTQPNPDFWTTIKPNMDSAALSASLQAMGVDPGAATDMDLAPTIRTISKTTGLVSTRPNPRYKQMDNAIVVKVDGQDRVIVFNKNDPRAARLVANLKNLDGAGMELAQKTIGVGTRFVASLATQYNPAFGPANAVRDTLGALVNLSSTAIAGKQLQVFAGIAAAAKGIYSEQTGGQGGKWTDLYKEFMLEGGQTGFREALKTADDRSKQIEKELGALASQGKLTTGKVLMALPKMVDGMNNIFENMVRLSAYKVALDNGQTKPQAARIARELTVDFNRKGAWAPGVGAFYAFFNASVQGNARTLATLMGKHGGKIVAGGIALGVMNAVMLAAAGFDDDEISEFAKTKAFIIPTGGKKFVSIPLPLGLHVLPNFGRVMTELYNSGGEDATAKVWGAFGEIAGSLNPFGGANPFAATGIVKMVTPTVLDPVGDLARGKDFADNPINKLDSQSRDRDPRPGYLLARESTMRLASGEVYKGIAEAINYATGGREFSKGAMSPTPEEVRYGIMAVGGGLLREIEKATNASLAPARGEKVKAHQIPLLGKFVGEVDDDTVQKTRFYKYSSKIQALEAELKAKAGKGDNIEPFMKDNPLSMLYPLNDVVNAELAKLNKAVGQNLADKDALKVLDAARLEYMRALNTQVRALEKASDKMTKAAEINDSVAEPDPEPEEELTE